ncbi:hypothetical protein ACSSV1_005854 [Labrenzia sp. MBR-25]
MKRLLRAIGALLSSYLNGRARGPYPHPATDLDTMRQRLLPADVVLVEGDRRISGAIKYLTQSTWSHAALYVGDHGKFDSAGRTCMLVEADTEHGVRAVALEELEGLHLRICRPVGLSAEDAGRVVDYALARIGDRYDLKNVFDLIRYLLPAPPVPAPWRRRLLSLGSGDPTRAICSTLIAQAFQSVRFPILPIISIEAASVPGCLDCLREIYHIRHHSLFVPRDFDVSPYFRVIKPGLSHVVDYREIAWWEADPVAGP